MFIYFYKLIFIVIFGLIGYTYPPFQGTSKELGAMLGAAFALSLLLLVFKIKKSELKHLWSASLGLLGGVAIGWIMFQLFNLIAMSFSAYVFFKALFLFGIPVTGFFIGISKPNMFSPLNIKEFFRGSSAFTQSYLLDTSAIIDGRMVSIALSGFVEGELIITQFVLAELQFIADSSDPNKKLRGKRGLDVIEQLQQNKEISVTILNKNVPGIKEVDQKLVLLAKEHNFKVITNDINLSKIAKLQDVKVLNVNELAFALKPIVYPGEKLQIKITKEGKEKKQGLAYLEDGTMVVVDDAKTDIGHELEIEVTSVLQSTSGKIIFGRKTS
ncbi:MAG: TRAM domain-containing protein [Chrysiogenales bacterium]|nr:MAG: TRAM domain-containing protein [Chrysiogenales bacterium]